MDGKDDVVLGSVTLNHVLTGKRAKKINSRQHCETAK